MKKISSIAAVMAMALMFAVVGCGGGSSKLNKSVKNSKTGNTDNPQSIGGSGGQDINPDNTGDGSGIQISDVSGAWIADRYNMVDSASGKTYESVSQGWKVGALIAEDGKVLFGVVNPNNANHADYVGSVLMASGPSQLSMNGHPFGVKIDGSTMTWTHVYFSDTVTVDIDWRPFDQKNDAWPKN